MPDLANYWHTEAVRKCVVSKIADVLKDSGVSPKKDNNAIEELFFQKSGDRCEYFYILARFMYYIEQKKACAMEADGQVYPEPGTSLLDIDRYDKMGYNTSPSFFVELAHKLFLDVYKSVSKNIGDDHEMLCLAGPQKEKLIPKKLYRYYMRHLFNQPPPSTERKMVAGVEHLKVIADKWKKNDERVLVMRQNSGIINQAVATPYSPPAAGSPYVGHSAVTNQGNIFSGGMVLMPYSEEVAPSFEALPFVEHSEPPPPYDSGIPMPPSAVPPVSGHCGVMHNVAGTTHQNAGGLGCMNMVHYNVENMLPIGGLLSTGDSGAFPGNPVATASASTQMDVDEFACPLCHQRCFDPQNFS